MSMKGVRGEPTYVLACGNMIVILLVSLYSDCSTVAKINKVCMFLISL